MCYSLDDKTIPCYALSEPDSGRLVYASPSAVGLLTDGRLPEYAWQLFSGSEEFAALYSSVRPPLDGHVPLRLPDNPLAGVRLLLSSLVKDHGRILRQDLLVLLADMPEQALTAATTLVGKYADALAITAPPPLEYDTEVRLSLFGDLTVETVRGKLHGGDITSRQSCLLLLYLLCNRGRVVPVYELAEALWPEQLLDNPYNMVKNVAFRLRRQLAPITVRPLIVPRHGTYSLNPELRFLVDADSFDALIRRYYRGVEAGDPRLLAAAIRLYRGTLLPFFDTELWLIPRCQYYKNAYRRAVLDYAGILGRQGQYMPALAVLRDALDINPRESALHMALIRLLAAEKGPAAARDYLKSSAPLLSAEEVRLLTRQLEQMEKAGAAGA